MKEKFRNNKKMISIIISILALIVLIGGSYAAFRYNFLGVDNLINIESVELEFLESSGEIIDLQNAFPMIDSAGKKQEETFDFQVKTKTSSNKSIQYSLYIEKLTADDGYTFLEDDEIKVYLTDFDGVEKVEPTKVSDLENYLLYSEKNNHNANNVEQKDKFKLRIWVDEEVTAEGWSENTKLQYKFKIGIKSEESNVNECNQVSLLSNGDTSGANAPTLSENMIPVYYDTCDETWKKADASNKDAKYRWYDYDDKLWANSVTVHNSNVSAKLNETNKSVNVTNVKSVTSYESKSSTTAINTMAFLLIAPTTGEISLDFEFTNNGEEDTFMVVVQDANTNEVILQSEVGTGTFTSPIPAESMLMIQMIHQTSTGESNASVSNIVMPEDYVLIDAIPILELQADDAEASFMPFERINDGVSPSFNITVFPMVGTDYSFNYETGKYELIPTDQTILLLYSILYNDYSSFEGGYICSDWGEISCTTMYKIKEVTNVVTKVDEYITVEKEGGREKYVEAPPGTEIPMEDILTMQVWVPRYKYTVWNYNSTGTVVSEPQPIRIEFENGKTTSGEIECTDNIQGTSDGTTSGTMPTSSEICKIKTNNNVCTDETCNGKTYTHPAFTFGQDELEGMWVGKFELSNDINCSPGDSNDEGIPETRCNLTSIRPNVKPNVKSWRSVMVSILENDLMAMNDENNKYGFAKTDDTHMIKNMDWGAVAYLSHSKYGTCTGDTCREPSMNNSDDYYTGTSAGTANGTGGNTYKYNTTKKEEEVLIEKDKLSVTATNDLTYPWNESDGLYKSSNQGIHNSTTNLEFSFTAPTDNTYLLFDWSVSSQGTSNDYLYYTITKDGTTLSDTGTTTRIGGTSRGTSDADMTYTSVKKQLEAGIYTLTFTYIKNGSRNSGTDTGYIKNIRVLDNPDKVYEFVPIGEGKDGPSASTTGNIYGIYDMNGGLNEYVMGNIVSPDGTTMMSGAQSRSGDTYKYSGYSGIVEFATAGGYSLITGLYEYPNEKYYDKYSFGTSYSERNRSKLGDGIKEVFVSSSYGWYTDYGKIPTSGNSWFSRGGYEGNNGSAGIFNSDYLPGYVDPYGSSRLVITQ